MNAQDSRDVLSTAELRKRVADRLQHHVSLAFSLDAGSNPNKKLLIYNFGDLLDISEYGICFKASGKFSPQSLINLYLKLSNETSGIRMLGKIIWVRPDATGNMRIGVRFIGTLPPDWGRLVGRSSKP